MAALSTIRTMLVDSFPIAGRQASRPEAAYVPLFSDEATARSVLGWRSTQRRRSSTTMAPVGCTLLSSIFIGPAGEQGRRGVTSVDIAIAVGTRGACRAF